VEVLNGCGIDGLAGKTADFLRARNFDIVKIDNARHSNYQYTIVQDRMGNLDNALKVARALGVKRQNVIQQRNPDLYLEVSVIIGKDWESLRLK